VKSSWYAPSRSTVRAPGDILATGLVAARSSAQSIGSRRRIVPNASSVANARSRSSSRERPSAPGITIVE
jgi:hypothetical protein